MSCCNEITNSTCFSHAALVSSARRWKAGARSSASRSMALCHCSSEQTSMRGCEIQIASSSSVPMTRLLPGKQRARVGGGDPVAVALRGPSALQDEQVIDGQRIDSPKDVPSLLDR
jgi:hypothetical protein